MDLGQMFCLRWNNYQATIQQVFHKLWISETFVDVSLVVEGKRIQCHRVVLSACSTYFENILRDHSAHPHPVILLHDLPYGAVEALVTFMYKGEVNVNQEHLSTLLRVASTLKIKGLADCSNFSNFTKEYLLEQQKLSLLQQSAALSKVSKFPVNQMPVLPIPFSNFNGSQRTLPSSITLSKDKPVHEDTSLKRPEPLSSPIQEAKKCKQERYSPELSVASVPSSKPCSDVSSQDSPRESIPATEVKQEASEDTDNELQIDESGSQHSDSTDSESRSSQDLPASELENCNQESLKSDVDQPSLFSQFLDKKVSSGSHLSNSLENSDHLQEKPKNGKNCPRSYTSVDLEEGIEAVLLGRLTPVKAIAQYKIPRRTFFRRLSVMRKNRGIPSAKENSADQFLSSQKKPLNKSNFNSSYLWPSNIDNKEKLHTLLAKPDGQQEPIDLKTNRKNDGTGGNYFSLLNLAASNNYGAYLNYLKMISQQSNATTATNDSVLIKDRDLHSAVDNNSNLSSEKSDMPMTLLSTNGSSD